MTYTPGTWIRYRYIIMASTTPGDPFYAHATGEVRTPPPDYRRPMYGPSVFVKPDHPGLVVHGIWIPERDIVAIIPKDQFGPVDR